MKTRASQIRAGAKYDRENTKAVYIKLNKHTDADILAALNCSGNKQGLIKAAVREYISRHK
jgi:hypothetical protein